MKENSFIAVDFETATHQRMICQIGITVVKNGVIQETITRLVQPPHNVYDYSTIAIHHITPEMTADEPTFDKVWEELSHYFVGVKIIAHNAAFDEDALCKNLEYYNIMPMGISSFECTYMMYGRSLEDLCDAFKMSDDNHHDAGFDSLCCAKFYLNYLNGIKPDYSLVREHNSNREFGKVIKTTFKGHEALHGDVLKKDLTGADPNNPFYDRKVVITGIFEMDRKSIGKQLKSMGADVDTNISKRTNFVLIGQDPGPAKLEKLENLIHNGYNIRKIYEEDFMAILSGDWEDYKSDKKVVKELDFTYEHYTQHHLMFDGLRNIIASKELYFGKGLRGIPELFYQMTGNLGAFGNWTLDGSVNICILSDSTIEKLKSGIKDETITYIQDFYNKNKSIVFDYDFMSESDILNYVLKRCDAYDDDVTRNLYNLYMQ